MTPGAHRNVLRCAALGIIIVCAALAGCSNVPSGYHKVGPTDLMVSHVAGDELSLLDVGVTISDARKLRDNQMKKLGTNEDIRNSERHFVPYHLKNTLQQSNQWGVVRVVPQAYDAADLRVTSTIARSNGEMLQVEVLARDGAGREWLNRKYHANGDSLSYERTSIGEHEAFQDLYNTIANDLAIFRSGLTPTDLERIREVSRLRFARDLVPDAFSDYLAETPDGGYDIRRLPSEDDPLMARVESIREREALFVDTLDIYYEGFYVDVWEAYENWRRLNHVELKALRQVKNEALTRAILGGLLIAAGVLAGTSGSSSSVGVASGVLIVAGSQVLIDGINVSEQANIHARAVEELGDSFGADMRPTVMELEGRQYELTGTVDEQFEAWRSLLLQIYLEETGFEVQDTDVEPNT